ncbi:hypothetical protein F5B17DRAFT_420369 [Nemania serpens]|nr:hypothetical protein F5B17DRAFT_420369 [Nemania serpens]
MFRARIGAQAFTVVAMVAGGAYYGADREKRKELIKLEAQKRAEERNQKWLRELEVRDEEDKKLQAAMKRKRERLEQREQREQRRAGEEATPTTATTITTMDTNTDTNATTTPAGVEPGATSTGGSGVLGALSSAGGWFGAKKEPAEKTKPEEPGVPKK